MESFSSCSKLIELTDAHKTQDDTLIIIVNEDGTISVDPSTLQKLLASQPNQNSRLSVVSVDSATYDDPSKVETSGDPAENSGSGTQVPTTSSSVPAPGSDYPLVDPFLDMDQEELQKLELALKSEKGRQILGENVAAMLDMLNKEGETHIAEGTHILSQNIHNDHCYSASTTKSLPTTPTKASTQTVGPKTIAIKTQNVKVLQESLDKKPVTLKQTTLGTQFRLVQSPGGVSQLILHKDGKPTILQRAVTSTSKPTTTTPSSNKTSIITSSNSSSNNNSNVEEEMVKAMESISTTPTGTTPSGGGSERKTVLRSHPASPATVVRAPAPPAPAPTPPQLPPSKYPRRENRRPPAHLVNEAFETPLAPSPSAQTISTPTTPATSRRQLASTVVPASDTNVPQLSNLPSPADQKISALDLLESIHAAVDIGGTRSSDEDEDEEDDDEIEEFNIDTSHVGVGSHDKLFDSPVKQPPAPSPSLTKHPPPFNLLSSAPLTEAKPSPDTTKPSVEIETAAMLPEMPHHPATEYFNVDNIEPTIGMELSTDHLTPTTLTLPHTTTLNLPHTTSSSLPHTTSQQTTSVSLPHTTTQPELGVISTINSSLPTMMVLPSSSSSQQLLMESQQLLMDNQQLLESPISSTVMTSSLVSSQQDVSESVTSHLTRSTGVSSLTTPITTLLHSTTPSTTTPPSTLNSTLVSSISHQQASSIIAHPPARSPAASVVAPDSTTHPETVATGGGFDSTTTTLVTAVSTPPLTTVKHVRKQVIPTTSASGVPATLSKALSSESSSIVKTTAAVAGKKSTTAATGGRRDSASRKSVDDAAAAAAVNKKRRSSESSRGRKSTDSSVPAAASSAVDDDDDMPEEDDASWNSEDDPDRLWCICQKPHNNRFMICCDSCDSWFHGKCVGITKAMGNQMEERGVEWRCPTCKEKLKTGGDGAGANTAPSAPAPVKVTPPQLSANRKTGGLMGSPNRKSATARKPRPEPAHDPLKKIHTASVQCVVCNKLDALQGSMYCSDACIQTHVTESLARIGTYKPDTHLIVFERKTGNILSGISAPTASSVRPWIQANPSYQVMAPSKLPTSQFYNKPGSGASGGATSKPQQTKLVKPSPTQKLNQQLMKANQEGLKELMKPVILTKQVKPADGSSTTPGSKIKVVKLVRTPLGGDKLKQELITKHLVPASSSAQSQQGGSTTSTSSVSSSSSSSSSNVKIIQLPTSATGGTKIVQLVKVPVHKSPAAGTLSARPTQAGTPSGTKMITIVPPHHQTPAPPPGKKGKFDSPGSGKKDESSNSRKETPTSSSSKKEPTPSSGGNRKDSSSSSKTPAVTTKKEVAKKLEKRDSTGSASKRHSEDHHLKEKAEKERRLEKEKEKGRESEVMALREKLRKRLSETLYARVKEDESLKLTEDKVVSLCTDIEEELYLLFNKDTGMKYKSKYRSIEFNVKDPKNLSLFHNIAEKIISPHQLVRLTPDEMASQELAQWREREAKHQLEMIKKNELENMSLAKTIVMKSHKGEEIIESEKSSLQTLDSESSIIPDSGSTKKQSLLDELKSSLEKDKSSSSSKKSTSGTHSKSSSSSSSRSKSSKKHRSRSRSRDRDSRDSRSSRHSSRSTKHNKSSSRDTKDRDRRSSSTSSTHHKTRSDSQTRSTRSRRSDRKSRSRSPVREKEKRSPSPEEKPEKDPNEVRIIMDDPLPLAAALVSSPLPPAAPLMESYSPLAPPPVDDDLEPQQPTSTVSIDTPPPPRDPEEEEADLQNQCWDGFLFMTEVTKFRATAHEVSGNCEDLMTGLPNCIECVGRISPNAAFDYLNKIKKLPDKSISVIRFDTTERGSYMSLYSYLSTKNRMAVAGNMSSTIKDFYIMPLASHSPIPQVLLPLNGPGFDDYRPALLLGILVRNRTLRVTTTTTSGRFDTDDLTTLSPPLPRVKRRMSTKMEESRSYTPPRSFTPPPPVKKIKVTHHPPPDETMGLDLDIPGDEDDPYDPGEDEPYSPGGSESVPRSSSTPPLPLPSVTTPDPLASTLEELNRKIADREKEIQNMTSSVLATPIITSTPGGDEAYSPSSSLSPSSDPNTDVSLPPNLSQILATIKEQSNPPSGASHIDPPVGLGMVPALPTEPVPPLQPPPLPPVMPEIKVNRDPRQRNEPPPPGVEEPPPPIIPPHTYNMMYPQAPVGVMLPPPAPQSIVPGMVPYPPAPPPVFPPLPLPPLPPPDYPPLPPPAPSISVPEPPLPPVIRGGGDSSPETTSHTWNKKNKSKGKKGKGGGGGGPSGGTYDRRDPRGGSRGRPGGFWKSGGAGEGGSRTPPPPTADWEKDIENFELQQRERQAKLRKLDRRHWKN